MTVGEAWAAYVAARSHKWGGSHKRDHEKAILPGGERITRGRKKGQGELSLPGRVHSLLAEPLKDLTPERIRFCRVKQFRRIATRYDKLASRFASFICLCAVVIWAA